MRGVLSEICQSHIIVALGVRRVLAGKYVVDETKCFLLMSIDDILMPVDSVSVPCMHKHKLRLVA